MLQRTFVAKLLATFLLVGCGSSKDTANPLLGTWQIDRDKLLALHNVKIFAGRGSPPFIFSSTEVRQGNTVVKVTYEVRMPEVTVFTDTPLIGKNGTVYHMLDHDTFEIPSASGRTILVYSRQPE